MPTHPVLPSLSAQAERLVALGVAELAGITADQLHEAASADVPDALLVVHPDRLAAGVLAPYLRHREKPGFVVTDLGDVDEFLPIPEVVVPAGDVYLVTALDRGDHLANWSPDEALPEILVAGRTPLTLAEGIHWLLQQPEVLERNHCFMTIGSRLRRATGKLDARTPAIWISNGTGRDGAVNRHAPKVGWCWAGNRHPWLGFGSAGGRLTGGTRAASGRPASAAGRG